MKTISPHFSALPRLAAGGVLLLLAAGCSSNGSVSGKVFYKDKPLTGGLVQFSHPQLGIVSSSIGADGSYQFAKIPPGEVKISVMAPAQEKGRALPKDLNLEKAKAGQPGVSNADMMRKMGFRPAPSAASADLSRSFPKKYADPLKSGLTYTVTTGSQTYDIQLD